MLLEVVCPGVPALENALQGGAQRIELCSDLSCGGITPSPGLTKLALEISEVPVFPLLRAREGDFVYSENEKKAMLYDIAAMADLGVHGVVVGSLTLPSILISLSRKRQKKQLEIFRSLSTAPLMCAMTSNKQRKTFMTSAMAASSPQDKHHVPLKAWTH